MKQLTLFHLPREVIFGGELLVGKRKTKRPLSTKHAIKTVIRGDVTQCGTFRAYPRRITKMINHYAKKFDIRVYEFSINSNHLHLLIKISQLKDFGRFMRALCGAMALEFNVKWYHRPWTRIVGWGRAFKIARDYVIKNQKESAGEIRYGRKVGKVRGKPVPG
jgi:REP element-mobilizing transposase RayT